MTFDRFSFTLNGCCQLFLMFLCVSGWTSGGINIDDRQTDLKPLITLINIIIIHVCMNEIIQHTDQVFHKLAY